MAMGICGTHMRIAQERTLDTVTGAEWRAASLVERQEFLAWWRQQGYVAFLCLTCSYPVAYGGAPCAACEGREEE